MSNEIEKKNKGVMKLLGHKYVNIDEANPNIVFLKLNVSNNVIQTIIIFFRYPLWHVTYFFAISYGT